MALRWEVRGRRAVVALALLALVGCRAGDDPGDRDATSARTRRSPSATAASTVPVASRIPPAGPDGAGPVASPDALRVALASARPGPAT